MKSWITYIKILITSCLLMTSCIEEEFDVPSEDAANVELRISMPSTDNYTKAGSNTVKPDGSEDATSYENTIVGTNDIHIFVFNSDGTYIGKAFDLQLIGSDDASIRILHGKLPANVNIGNKIKLVFMANYGSRGATPAEPGNKKYTKWSKSLTFSYGNTSWSANDAKAKDKKYIPMSGECSFTVQKNNYQNIDLVRAIAKIRVKVKKGCEYKITSLQTHNASDKGYSLKHSPFAVPSNGNGLFSPLNFDNQSIDQNSDPFEFYIPEQASKQTELRVFLNGSDKNETPIEFKYYPEKDKYYPIERNYIYEFIINKKKDEAKADVQVNIMPWTVHDINSDYE